MHMEEQACGVSSSRLCSQVSHHRRLCRLGCPLTVPRYAPFVYDAWHNPRVLSIISDIAGVELIPNMNLEIGHVNISVKSDETAREERAAVERERRSYAEDEGIAGCPWEDDKPVVGWHNDSYPFVCVTMLSDCTNMIGGETALRTGNGDVMKVRGPQKVSSQSTHQARHPAS